MSIDLLDTAEHLLNRVGGSTPSDICRAISTTYYALFHCLAKNCSDLFLGDNPANRPQRAWNHLYRSLNHATIDARCGSTTVMRNKNFDQKLIDFAEFTRNMQWKRKRCDYSFALSPDENVARSDIALARGHIADFHGVTENHKRAFAVYLLFKDDRHEKKIISV